MMNDKASHRYDDIIALPHKVSASHRQMTMEERAAQFSPFAALTGYNDSIAETARVTESRIELEEDEKAALDKKLRFLRDALNAHPRDAVSEVSITYFLPDTKKSGGAYVSTTSPVKKIYESARVILLSDDTRVPIDDIAELRGPFFQTMPDFPD